jgi:hypothetical protein
MTVCERKELREKTHLEIAMSAAVNAGLATNQATARRKMEQIIENHGPELKAQWLRERGGGIKGWLCFLRTYGFEERLEVRRIRETQQPKRSRKTRSESNADISPAFWRGRAGENDLDPPDARSN